MKLVKTFDTTEMNEIIFKILLDTGYFVEDGVTIYHVGGYVSEYELTDPEDKKRYPLDEIEKMRKFDDYLISNGAENGENVFIYHGTYYKMEE